jgi:hypothetical protein
MERPLCIKLHRCRQRQLGNWGQELNDYAQLGAEGLQLLWEAIQLAWQVLSEWGDAIFRAVQSCLSFISSIATTAIHDITAFMDKIGAIAQEILKDAQLALSDEEKGDDLGALAALMDMLVNPELMLMGQQMVSPQEMEQILEKQAPWLLGLWDKLPLWAKIAIIASLIAGVALLAFAAKSGGGTSADQQKRINSIRQQLATEGISVSNTQIQDLIKAGYSDAQIISILKTADLNQSGKMYIADYAGHKVYGHTLSLHVNIDNTDLKNRARTKRSLATTFKNQVTAQNAVNHAIANSSTLQDFINHGATNSTASDTVCYNTKPLPNLGYGYRPINPPPKVEKVGPLHCMHVVLAKTILGLIFVLTTYPVPG